MASSPARPNGLIARLARTRLRLEDFARVRGWSGYLALAKILAALFRRDRLPDAVARLVVSVPGVPGRRTLVARALAAGRRRFAQPQGPAAPLVLTRSIIIKPQLSQGERGILVVSFENELLALVRHASFEQIEKQYLIAFLPTWTPCHSEALLLLAARAKLPYVLMPAGREDMDLAQELGENCIVLPLQAASWIPLNLRNDGQAKRIDLLLLANFSKYKRHWRLFEALGQIDEDVSVVCAGRPWGGRTEETLRREARLFGVEDRIRFVVNPTDAEVADLLGAARLFCAMSHKEGSFIAVAEALVAGTPVGMFKDASIGTKTFINPETGVFFDPRRPLGAQIASALRGTAGLQPAAWARANIVAEESIRRFNAALREWHVARGLPWTRDAAPVYCRNFDFFYSRDTDAAEFKPLYARAETELSLALKGFGSH